MTTAAASSTSLKLCTSKPKSNRNVSFGGESLGSSSPLSYRNRLPPPPSVSERSLSPSLPRQIRQQQDQENQWMQLGEQHQPGKNETTKQRMKSVMSTPNLLSLSGNDEYSYEISIDNAKHGNSDDSVGAIGNSTRTLAAKTPPKSKMKRSNSE